MKKQKYCKKIRINTTISETVKMLLKLLTGDDTNYLAKGISSVCRDFAFGEMKQHVDAKLLKCCHEKPEDMILLWCAILQAVTGHDKFEIYYNQKGKIIAVSGPEDPISIKGDIILYPPRM